MLILMRSLLSNCHSKWKSIWLKSKRKSFYEFQDDLWHSLVDKSRIYVKKMPHIKYIRLNRDEGVPRVREIIYNKILDFGSCCCKKFESKWIPCRHIFAYLRLFDNFIVPKQYILRWTKVLMYEVDIGKNGIKMNAMSCNSMFMWWRRLFQLASDAIDKAIKNEKASVIIRRVWRSMLQWNWPNWTISW